MEAVQFDSKTKKVQLVHTKIPDINDSEVLIKVHYAGVCGTDIHIIDGEFTCKESPFILGHEFCGIVQKIGSNVTNVNTGDRVVVNPNNGCKCCDPCRSGNPHYCTKGGLNTTLGIFIDGGFAQYCSVPAELVHQIPETITLQQAALCEPLSCISHGVDKMKPLVIGHKILVIGAGIIGHLFTALLHLKGHKHVTVSESNEARRANIKKLNTNYKVIDPSELINSSQKFDVAIDCSGNKKAMEQAFSMLEFGGQLAIFSVPKPTDILEIPAFPVMKKELSIQGVMINPFSFNNSISIIESMGDRYIDYDKLGVKIFALKEYEKAIKCLREGSVVKAMFQIS